MTHYMDADKLIEELARLKSDVAYAAENEDDFPVTHGIYLGLDRAIHSVEIFPTADVAPKSEVEKLQIELEAMRGAANSYKMHYEKAKAEVIEEYRQRVNTKMGKHTHLLGKEYVQRILREVAKEMKNE